MNSEPDFIEQIRTIYDFVDTCSDGESRIAFVRDLMVIFNHISYHQSIIKTLLVVSKGFKDNPNIIEARTSLLVTYNKKRELNLKQPRTIWTHNQN